MLRMLAALWRYRVFVLTSIRGELATRFCRSTLGGLWIILNPLAQVAIYALILSNVLAARTPGIDNKYSYAIYLTAGLMGWNLFSDILTRCVNLFIGQANLIKKVMFPRMVLPVIAVGVALVDNAMLLVAGVGVMAILGHFPSSHLLWLPFLALTVVVFALGLGFVLGILNVFIRDVGQVVPIVLQVAFWFTPIVYPIGIIPESYRSLLMWNPMFPLVQGYHNILVYGRAPSVGHVLIVALVGVGLIGFGLLLFRRAVEEMVDVL